MKNLCSCWEAHDLICWSNCWDFSKNYIALGVIGSLQKLIWEIFIWPENHLGFCTSTEKNYSSWNDYYIKPSCGYNVLDSFWPFLCWMIIPPCNFKVSLTLLKRKSYPFYQRKIFRQFTAVQSIFRLSGRCSKVTLTFENNRVTVLLHYSVYIWDSDMTSIWFLVTLFHLLSLTESFGGGNDRGIIALLG